MSDTKNVASKDENLDDVKSSNKEDVQAPTNAQAELKSELDRLKAENETLAKEKESLAAIQSKKDLTANEMQKKIEALESAQARYTEEKQIGERLDNLDAPIALKTTLKQRIATLTLDNIDSEISQFRTMADALIASNNSKVDDIIKQTPDVIPNPSITSIEDAKTEDELRKAFESSN